jgi:ribosomal protein S18 acetylase RimI-like enzyme
MTPIEPLAPALIGKAVETLVRAFEGDPMFGWIFPEPRTRTRALRRLNQIPVRYGLRYGRVMQADDAGAVAIWIPPGRRITMGGMIRSGMLTMPFHVGLRAFGQFGAANTAMERIHHRHMLEPHWYLFVLGVDPSLQRRGAGTALLEEGLARADAAKVPSYLETSHERNLSFYQRHGFRVLESAPLGEGAPSGWAMRRDART